MSDKAKHIMALDDAVAEAQRFIIKAQSAQNRLMTDQYACIIGSPETAAAKRASMDLTRALVKVRRGGR